MKTGGGGERDQVCRLWLNTSNGPLVAVTTWKPQSASPR